MKPKYAIIAALAGAAYATPAMAQELPTWRLDAACARETSDRAFCIAFEGEAYSRISGIWPTLLPEIRQACLEQIAAFGQNSYRLLDGCVEEKLTEARIDYVRRALRADVPDPPRTEDPEPPATATPDTQPGQASEATGTTGATASDQPAPPGPAEPAETQAPTNAQPAPDGMGSPQ